MTVANGVYPMREDMDTGIDIQEGMTTVIKRFV